ncbi:hypothetical protein FHW17_001616 [Phyllobacterium sp. P30BS-XVII]|nr:hypothetical protein [Phyllobacterium sp. P30BS-XVII]
MQFYFAKPLANDKNLPQNFTQKEIEPRIVSQLSPGFDADGTLDAASRDNCLSRDSQVFASYMAVQGRRGRSPNTAPEGKPGDGNIRARFRSFWGEGVGWDCSAMGAWFDKLTVRESVGCNTMLIAKIAKLDYLLPTPLPHGELVEPRTHGKADRQ